MGLQEQFEAKGMKEVWVLCEEKAGLEEIVSSKSGEIGGLQPHLIYVMNGHFYVIGSDKGDCSSCFCYTSSGEAVENYAKKVCNTHEILSQNCKSAKVVYAPVAG